MKRKLEIFKPSDNPEPGPFRLALQQRADGRVVLVAVEANGDRLSNGSLLSVYTDGTVLRHRGVDQSLFGVDQLPDVTNPDAVRQDGETALDRALLVSSVLVTLVILLSVGVLTWSEIATC